MAAKSSIVPDIIWNWVVEALATSEQADASTLIGLVRMTPAIAGELGKDAKEVVSLRILESLFPQGDEAVVDADAGQNGKISFKSSERCQDVLKQILHETPEHSAKLEKEKWDVRPFLTHKRSSLPKCVLQKLKEAILESNNPLLASLKEKSKIVDPNASENVSPVNDGNLDVQDTVAKDDLVFLNPRKDKDKLQEKRLQGDADQVVNDENLPQNTYDKRVSVDSMENLEFANNSKTKSAQPNILDSEPLSKEKNLISMEDSLINLCLKCNEGGDLLICSSDSCPIQVHERCLGFDVTHDENAKFFCPFCAYSRAISKYNEAKRKASLARNDLLSFSSFSVKPGQNESIKKQSEFEKNEGKIVGKVCESPKGMDPVQGVNKSEIVNKHIQNSIPEPSTPKRKCKEKESQRSIESSSLGKRKLRYRPPTPVHIRLNPWTKLEEETLKEGVERYSSVNDNVVPWKEILDFGHDVFRKGRSPMDLLDKWRNICKRSRKGK
ncbi:hypothetical protein L2E82_12589 [Cichorium intybus]|uniref:Uncharacterized protein n=1 Tax=Cichorium intybus TaxID=13427 RepID=A0ACB9GGH9_CICIN|nr:hypothetical protein L2E82_12589 [Cichorium intybus]